MNYSEIVTHNFGSLRFFVPELVLCGTIVVLIVADLIVGKDRIGLMCGLALGGLALTLAAILFQPVGQTDLFSGTLVLDPFATYFKILAVVALAFAILSSANASDVGSRGIGEYATIMLSMGLGMFIMVSAINLITIFLAFEMVSLTSYVLTGHLTHERRSSEAALKYVIFSASSAAIFLYGMSWLYGLTGSLYIPEIATQLVSGASPLAVGVAVVFILAGLGYKIAAVPFHFWAPDAYTGAPTPVAALLSVGPKAAGMALLARFLYEALAVNIGGAWVAVYQVNWPVVVAIIAAVTMTLGNLSAIWQSNIKRLLAYSSIAHAGYVLMGLAMLSQDGLRAMMFYMAVYLFMNFGAFLVIIALGDKSENGELSAFVGLGHRSPLIAIAMALFVVSLAGLPPTSGFIGKLYLLIAVWKEGVYWLALVAAFNTVVALYVYAKILRAMFLEEAPANAPVITVAPLHHALIVVLMVPTLLLGLYWTPLMNAVDASLHLLAGK